MQFLTANDFDWGILDAHVFPCVLSGSFHDQALCLHWRQLSSVVKVSPFVEIILFFARRRYHVIDFELVF